MRGTSHFAVRPGEALTTRMRSSLARSSCSTAVRRLSKPLRMPGYISRAAAVSSMARALR